jgi:hypothetical protein
VWGPGSLQAGRGGLNARQNRLQALREAEESLASRVKLVAQGRWAGGREGLSGGNLT